MKKRLSTMLLVLILIMHPQIGLADLRGSQYFCGVGGESAYAWTSKYLFVAHGFSMPDENDWVSRHYSISIVDRDSGEVSTLKNNVYGSALSIYASDTSLFLFYQIPDLRPDGDIHTYSFQELDLFGNTIKQRTFSLHGYIQDEIAKKNNLYLITYDSIYVMGIDDEYPSIVYSGVDIQNDRHHTHIICDESSLYFQDETMIKKLDLIDYSIMEICENEFNSSNDYYYKGLGTNIPSNIIHYSYMIIDGMLYYYRPSEAKMMRRRVDNLHEDAVCNDECYFFQVESEGMIISVKDTNVVGIEFQSHFDTFFVEENPFTNQGVFDLNRAKLIPSMSILIGKNQYIIHQDAVFQRDADGREIIESIHIYTIPH